MTGFKTAFFELDDDVTDTMKFGDGSRVAIRGRGTIIFRCQNGAAPSSEGSEVLIKDGVLRMKDREQQLLAKVKRSRNWLYLLVLKVEQPIYLVARHMEESWLWHVRYGHLSFDALDRLQRDRGSCNCSIFSHILCFWCDLFSFLHHSPSSS